MKGIKKMMYAALIVAPLLLPAKSNANPIDDILNWLFGNGNNNNGNNGNNGNGNNGNGNNGKGGNTAPIDSGLVILLVAGAGLGAKILYDSRKKRVEEEVPVS